MRIWERKKCPISDCRVHIQSMVAEDVLINGNLHTLMSNTEFFYKLLRHIFTRPTRPVAKVLRCIPKLVDLLVHVCNLSPRPAPLHLPCQVPSKPCNFAIQLFGLPHQHVPVHFIRFRLGGMYGDRRDTFKGSLAPVVLVPTPTCIRTLMVCVRYKSAYQYTEIGRLPFLVSHSRVQYLFAFRQLPHLSPSIKTTQSSSGCRWQRSQLRLCGFPWDDHFGPREMLNTL